MSITKPGLNKYFAVIVFAFIFSVVMQPTTAFAGVYPGIDNNTGYFGGNFDNSGIAHNGILPGYDRCNIMAAGDVNAENQWSSRLALQYSIIGTSKTAYRDYLKGQYDAHRCEEWSTEGVAFIVHTMLGHTPIRSASLSAADWAEFDDMIINNANIIMSFTTASPRKNSYSIMQHYDNGAVPPYRGDPKDSYFYEVPAANTPDSDLMYEFKGTNSGYYYGVKLRCGNPAGEINPVVPQWSINGQSYIQIGSTDVISDPLPLPFATYDAGRNQGTINATPGDRLWWDHDMRNSGPSDMERTVYFNIDRTGFSNGWNAKKDPSGDASGLADQLFVYEYAYNARSFTSYKVTQNDVGNTLCQRIAWQDEAWNDTTWGWSEDACAFIPYNYSLSPSVSTDISGAVEAGTTLHVKPSVDSAGPTKSRSTQWQVSYLTLAPGAGIPGGGLSGNVIPCDFFNTALTCANIANGNGVYLPGINPLSDVVVSIDDLPVGTRVCYALSVKDYDSNIGSGWTNSDLECLVVGKKPKMQVWGGDTVVRGDIITSTTNKIVGGVFGSWGQYSVISSGFNSAMASGSGLSGGSADSSQSKWSKLTFANVGGFGNYNSTLRAVPAIASRLSTIGTATELPDVVDDVNTLTGVLYKKTGDLEIKGGTLMAGRSVIISVTGKIKISGDVRYTNGILSSITEIPQMVLMAKYIDVTQNVTNVDAWLIASQDAGGAGGEVNTCSTNIDGSLLAVDAKLTSTMCNQPLMINGPVVANKLYLRRTAGSGVGVASGDPAEIINLRPDAYLWAYQRAAGASRAQTVLTTELPPRF